MTKNIIVCLLVFLVFRDGFSQGKIRIMNDAERKRYVTICSALNECLPQTFKDYSVETTRCDDFSWCEMDYSDKNNPKPLVATNEKNLAYGTPSHVIYYKMNPDSADYKEQLITVKINDAISPNGTVDKDMMALISAEQEKFLQCKTLYLMAQVNVPLPIAEQYAVVTKPQKLDMPINAFAYLYTFPDNIPILDENGDGQGGTDANEFYKDKAFILISNKQPKVKTTIPAIGKQTWIEETITSSDITSNTVLEPVKNIYIQINGWKDDVLKVIQQIDWKKLQAILGK
ncbi:MAG TPA: hypothetical protein PK431_08820 [Chitinophagales bacterium]|nr:hypothetical protein [Chitinophagales bacterium]